MDYNKKTETAVFGGGCFWCTEAIFKNLKGVESVVPGYAGGTLKNPGYHAVSSGETGHAEVIKIEFNPEVISYSVLLDVFWHTHNPTTLNQQGNDVGTQYRSIILYTTEEQKIIAERSLEELKKSDEYHEPVVTEIKSLDKFYEAEDYHKNFYNKNKDEPYCKIIISPKLDKLKIKYADYLTT
jgi:peptide-methionine (S)-S-oxide reductase